MLVRKCDVCNHIIGDEDGYMMDIFKTSVPRGAEVRTKTLNISLEICSECKQAMFNALKREIDKYVLIEKEQEAEKNIKNTLKLNITGATLLTAEEAHRLPGRLLSYNSWWWLKSPCRDFDHVAVVNYGGINDSYGNYVGHDDFAIRPALIISNLESSGLEIGNILEFGNKWFEVISDHLAFCLNDIGRCAFRENPKAPDANDYEKSDVKKFIDNWFKKVKETGK